MRTNILCLFITVLTMLCFLSPSILMGESYVFDFQIPSEVLGLRSPSGVAADSSGNVYVADTGRNRIVKYDPSGNLLLVIGSYGQFYHPSGVAVDNSGYVYVAVTDNNCIQNNRIQKFDSSGVYQTQWGSYGDGTGQFRSPRGLAVDNSGYVYVVDNLNERIQKFDSSGVYQTKWGNGGSGGNGEFSSPSGVAVDNSGYVYVADTWNNRIQKFDSSGVYQTQWGTKGTGDGQFNSPSGVAVDSSGYVYVADTGNGRIQKFDSSGVYQTQWGTKGTGDGQFNSLSGVAVDSSGYVYVADTDNDRIQKFDSSGVYQTQWGTEGSGNGQFYLPKGVAVDNTGYVYVADTDNDRIQKFDSSGVYQTQWGSHGNGNGQFINPVGVAVDSSGYIYVADSGNHRIQKFDSNGVYQTKWGSYGTGNGQFYYPEGLAVDSSGYVYVADTVNRRIQKFDSNGVYQTKWGGWGTSHYPAGVAVDSSEYVYVAADDDYIRKFDSSGVYQTYWGSWGSGDGQFSFPSGVAVDNSGYVYVAESARLKQQQVGYINDRIQKFDSSGVYQTKWGTEGSGNGQFCGPFGVAVDSSGKVYVADTGNHRIQVFRIGIMTTAPTSAVVAGSDIPFSSSITILNITTATLYYKKGGEASYQSASLNQSGTTWSTIIPAGYNTTRGVAYYIDAVDNLGAHYYGGDASVPNNISVHGAVGISSKTTPSGSSNVWNIVGPSVVTDDKSIVNNLGSGFGTTWIAWRWVLSRWEVPTAFGGNPVTSDPFDAGTSWFYALDGDGSYVTKNVSGTSRDVRYTISVPLKGGWNLICNPFDFSVAWSDSTIMIGHSFFKTYPSSPIAVWTTVRESPTGANSDGWVDNRAIWYNPDTKAYVTRYSYESTPYAMPKTRGQWLYSAVNDAWVEFKPIEYTGSPAPPSKPKDDSSLWKIELTLKSSKGSDTVEAISDNKGQTSIHDMKPPSLPISVSRISFVRDGIELSSDRQRESNEMIWTFSADATESSLLEWKLIGVPAEYKLSLEDEGTGSQIDVRQVNNLPIDKGKAGHRYILKATRTSVPKVTRLLANYPNPFNPDTWIPYELSEVSEVAIRIYTTTGYLVRTLNLGRKEAGYYTTKDRSAYWDGKNEYGEQVASGIYFYSIKAGNYTSTHKMVILK